jgi:predicted metal-dependent HD superfamily phosphohydrolase
VTPDERRARWLALWRRLGAQGDGAAAHDELVRHWAEPGRHYHTLEHLDACLATFDDLAPLCDHPDEAEAALWCHDVIWSAHGTDDEGESAAWAEACLGAARVAPDTVARIADLVRATRHGRAARSADEAVVLDADLAILGADPAAFDRYEAQVRAEYAHVPEAAFRAARARILRRFLERPAIFGTSAMRAGREWAAQANLGRSLLRLEG